MNHNKNEIFEREFIFNEYRKWLMFFIQNEDVMDDFGDSSKIIENLTLEQLRNSFSLGYRFALLQIIQYSNSIQLEQNGEKISSKKIIGKIEDFSNNRIEDSFSLNKNPDNNPNFFLSKKLKKSFYEQLDRDYLSWFSNYSLKDQDK